MEIFLQHLPQVIIIERENKSMPLWLILVLITLVVGVVATLIVNYVPDTWLAAPFKKVLFWGAIIGLIIMWFVQLILPLINGMHVTH